jgi:integrase
VPKRDYKRELAGTTTVDIYTKAELDALFAAMDEDDHLLFSTIKEAALRKKEAMHLEDSDLIHDEIAPGIWKCEIRVRSKPHWGWQTKMGWDRDILISRELIDRLLKRSAAKRPSTLLFGTSNGKPDYHFLDRLKAVGKKAGLDQPRVWTHKLRATTATTWLRSKELGGKGWDIGFVRQQLGHADYKSIEAYIAIVRNEEIAMREHDDGQDNPWGEAGTVWGDTVHVIRPPKG